MPLLLNMFCGYPMCNFMFFSVFFLKRRRGYLCPNNGIGVLKTDIEITIFSILCYPKNLDRALPWFSFEDIWIILTFFLIYFFKSKKLIDQMSQNNWLKSIIISFIHSIFFEWCFLSHESMKPVFLNETTKIVSYTF